MKKIILTLLLIITSISYSQKVSIELKNGYKTQTDKIRYLSNGNIVFQDINGLHKEKKSNIKSIKPVALPKDKFVYNQLGLTPFVVEKFDSIPQAKLMQLIKNWIKETYKNPDKVIKSVIENKKIRFEGFTDCDISVKGLGSKIYGEYEYSIVISVKDNKYKFQVISLTGAGQAGANYSINLNDGSAYFTKIGVPRNSFRDFVVEVGDLFNKLNNSLKEYILKNKNGNSEEDDW